MEPAEDVSPATDHLARQPTPPRWLAEWESHVATWLAWPHNAETWPQNLVAAQDEFEQLIRCLAEREIVRLLVSEEAVATVRQRGLDRVQQVEVWPIPTNDAWVRDYGPTVVHDREGESFHCVDWQYNAWGDKYPPYMLDQQVARRCAEQLGCASHSVPWVVEGGALEGNGAGLLLTTESCLFEKHRNPHATRSDYEQLFQAELGIERVLWLPGGDICGDDTDGHIDQIARFLGPSRVVIADEPDDTDPNHTTFAANQAALQSLSDTHHLQLELIPLRGPGPVTLFGNRLPASYANFIWTNGGVIVPQFDDPHDERAVALFAELLPDRDVLPLPCRQLLVGLGAWHCLSQQHCAPSRASL